MRLVLVTLLILVGLAAIAVGIVYTTVAAGSLPSFIPGHIAHSAAHHYKRGYAAFGAGAVLIIAGIIAGMVGQPKRHGSLR